MRSLKLLVLIITLYVIYHVAIQCTNGPSPVGLWESFTYPADPPAKPFFMELRANGEYSLSDLPGHGTWSQSGDHLTLNEYSGAKSEELIVEGAGKDKRLSSIYTDGGGFMPVAGTLEHPRWLEP